MSNSHAKKKQIHGKIRWIELVIISKGCIQGSSYQLGSWWRVAYIFLYEQKSHIIIFAIIYWCYWRINTYTGNIDSHTDKLSLGNWVCAFCAKIFLRWKKKLHKEMPEITKCLKCLKLRYPVDYKKDGTKRHSQIFNLQFSIPVRPA